MSYPSLSKRESIQLTFANRAITSLTRDCHRYIERMQDAEAKLDAIYSEVREFDHCGLGVDDVVETVAVLHTAYGFTQHAAKCAADRVVELERAERKCLARRQSALPDQLALMWRAEKFTENDKTIVLIGPSDGFYPQAIYVDFDDVNHPEIERRLPLMIDALNGLDLQEPTDFEQEV